MTKRWSATVSDLSKTKRQASKDARQLAKRLRELDEQEPEAAFDNVEDMLRYLNDGLAHLVNDK